MSTPTAAIARNAPCPCGSGRRYKECHGAVGAGVPGGAAPPAPALTQRMHAAIEAQRAGRIVEAIALYDDVLREAPRIADAWHMRGVARFQLHDYDPAEADIVRAIELAPDLANAQENLALVRQGRRIAGEEAALCLAILPRFRAMVVDPPVDPLDGVGDRSQVWILDGGTGGPRIPDAIEQEARGRGAIARRIAIPSGGRIDGETAAALGRGDDATAIVGIGCTRPFGDWTFDTRAGIVALIAGRDPIAAFEERLGELSGQRRRRVRVALGRDATLPLGPLPHWRSRTW